MRQLFDFKSNAILCLKYSIDINTLETKKNYYNCFKNKDWKGMLALVNAEIKHKRNQGKERIGIELFTAFLQKMDECYEEAITEFVFLVNQTIVV